MACHAAGEAIEEHAVIRPEQEGLTASLRIRYRRSASPPGESVDRLTCAAIQRAHAAVGDSGLVDRDPHRSRADDRENARDPDATASHSPPRATGAPCSGDFLRHTSRSSRCRRDRPIRSPSASGPTAPSHGAQKVGYSAHRVSARQPVRVIDDLLVSFFMEPTRGTPATSIRSSSPPWPPAVRPHPGCFHR